MSDQINSKNRAYTVIGLALAMFLGALDQTIVSTALPRVVEQLGGLDRYTWVTTMYLLISTLLVPLYGKLADIISRKALEIWSVTTFLIGSALCGMAGEWGTLPLLGDGMTQLIVFRGIQGIGGAGLFALAFIIIADLYPPRERGKIGGVFGAVFGLSSVLGPLIGGFLTDNAGSWIPSIEGWRWVFYVNLPLGAIALWFIITRMPRLQPPDNSHQMDFVSVGLMLLTFFPLVFALQLDKTDFPWTSWQVAGQLAASLVFGVLWVWHSLKVSEHPIIDLRLFKNPVFLATSVAGFLFGAAFLSIVIFLPLYMVNVQGVSATGAGASVIPMTLGIVFGASLGGPLASKLGRYKAILVAGSFISLVAGILMVNVGLTTPLWQVILTMVVTGLGFGPGMSLYALAVQNVVPREEIGQATSFNQFVRQIGSTSGAAVAGAIFSAALTVAFAAHMPASNGPQSFKPSASAARQGPVEIRKTIEEGFDKNIATIEALFDLRGEEARAALDKFEADPDSPAELKARLKNGTPAMGIEAGFRHLEAALEGAIITGNKTLLEGILKSPAGAPLPPESVKALQAIVVLPAKAREAAVPKMREQMLSGMDMLINAQSALATAKVRAQLEDLKKTTADKVVSGLKSSFADAISPIWWFNLVVFGLLVIATFFIPSVPLKGGRQGPPGEAPNQEVPPAVVH